MLVNFLGIGPALAVKLAKDREPATYDEAVDLLRKQDSIPKATLQDINLRPWKILPRNLIDHLNNDLKLNFNYRFDIAGSYRRGLQCSGDVDIVIQGSASECYQTLCSIETDKFSFVTTPYAMGDDRISLCLYIPYCKIYIICDMFFTTPEEYAYMLFYATGSKEFNIKMRARAKKIGGVLNQRSLVVDGVSLPAASEEQIMQHLGLQYVDPRDR